MALDEPLRRLLLDLMAVGGSCPLLLAGGHAAEAHGLAAHAGAELELATDAQTPMAELTEVLRAGLEARGRQVRELSVEPLEARLAVSDPAGGGEYRVGIGKETLWRPPVPGADGPVLALEDLVGIRVRALADRGLAADLAVVRAAARDHSPAELEEWGRRHARDGLELADLQARLEGVEWLDDREFAACGLDPEQIAGLRAWAQGWADDIGERLAEEAPYEEDE
ncbi:hypothetical protein [Streptomyces orinoci]|uniref:Nucleotidyl transferase AbiEii/AbiGii toxin family protein n=1 Tax=Streptomyces orinoci TaxID=67339 RepID=A0ABV3K174_STRON|nr:hypothetical protein [Streptomyces orinoci]